MTFVFGVLCGAILLVAVVGGVRLYRRYREMLEG